MKNNQKKVSEAQSRAHKKYIAKYYRPSIIIERSAEPAIKQRCTDLGLSVNEYINRLIVYDIKHKIL